MAAQQKRWTQEDTDWLIENAHQMSASQLAENLGRTLKSIQRKAEQLRLPIWRDDQFGDGLRDIQGRVQIGNRRLLAKTCPKCGRFLMSRRFFRRKSGGRKGHWYVNCRACTAQLSNDRRSNEDRTDHNTRRKNQQASQRNAWANATPWTQAEDDVLRDTENVHTLIEAATLLGRTYRACQSRCEQLGIHRATFADVGKVWMITFPGTHDPGHGIGARMETEDR